jgi:uncharacterized membrane protein YdjX (TVP38/TMEM64 family)
VIGADEDGQARGAGRLWRPFVLLAAVAAVVFGARALGVEQQIQRLRAWIETLGAWAPLAFVLAYILATIAALPGSILTVAAGALFGSVWGVALVSLASTTGASAAFLIARYVARDSVTRWVADRPAFARLDDLAGTHGAKVVAITRLVPFFPFNLLNYGFGLTGISFWKYVFWSWLCMLPGTVLYVVGSDVVFQAMAQGDVPWALVGVLAAALAVVVLLVAVAGRRLRANDATSTDKDSR